MGETYHCWHFPMSPGDRIENHQHDHPCCSCGALKSDETTMVTFTVEYTKSREQIRSLAKDDCVICGGAGLVGEHKPTVCSCVDPSNIFSFGF